MCTPGPQAMALSDGSRTIEVQVDSLVEFLRSEFERGVPYEEVEIASPFAGEPAMIVTDQVWSSCCLKHPEANRFQDLYTQWKAGAVEHQASKKLLASRGDLWMRLLAFVADLRDYQNSVGSQKRLDSHLPNASGPFKSPVYFTEQEGKLLDGFVAANGVTVLDIFSKRFESTPNFEGVCTAHIVVPLLKRLFSISNKALESKQFKEFRQSFNMRSGSSAQGVSKGTSSAQGRSNKAKAKPSKTKKN